MKQYLWAFVLGVLFGLIGQQIQHAYPMEGDDHGNHGPLKTWFDQLASKKGMCCSFADGVTVKDVDWDTATGDDGKTHYRVFLEGGWVPVPDEAVIEEPNRYGPAVVWPYRGPEPGINIRCFMPGAGM